MLLAVKVVIDKQTLVIDRPLERFIVFNKGSYTSLLSGDLQSNIIRLRNTPSILLKEEISENTSDTLDQNQIPALQPISKGETMPNSEIFIALKFVQV